MAFFQLVLKANKLRNIRRIYHEEKLHSIQISQGIKVHYTLRQRIRHKKILLKQKLGGFFRKFLPKNTWIYKKYVLLKTEGTLENYILRSVYGFIGGILLTYIFFVFFVFQLNFSLTSTTLICAFIGVFLTMGLAFSPRMRCTTMLFLPQFFSKRGRQALMAYAFILALTGPGKNILHNIGVLTESLSCSQELLKEALKSVINLIKQPFYALKDSLSKIIKSLKSITKKIKATLIAVKRIVVAILRIIKSVFEWLGNVVKICNKEFGTPFDRCENVFKGAVADCRVKLGPLFNHICNLSYVAGSVCYVVKPLDFICSLVSYVSDAIVGVIRKKLKKFVAEMRAMFYVKIKFSHSFEMQTNKSKSIREMASEISTEIKTKTNRIFSLFDWTSFLATFFFFILILRVISYRHKWLTKDRFDNHYISKHMRDIDLKRTRQEKETIFPLNHRERSKYISLSSVLLLKIEQAKLAKTLVFLSLASVKLIIYMTIDYCLFWVLNRIRYHGRTETKVQRLTYSTSVEIKGKGFLAEIYQSIVKAFYPKIDESEIDTIPCLPDPKPPNYDIYVRILILVFFCWLTAVLEPYGLRLRHVVLNSYYPDRAKQRAVWLYNHIIRSRGSFLKFARRQLRRKFGLSHGDSIERVTCRERIWAIFPLLDRLWPLKLKNACLVCGQPERDKMAPHVNCPTPGCVGVFCPDCFQDLRKMCTICKSPLDYGDLTDMSEERDSSDDQIDISKLKTIHHTPKTEEDEMGEEVEIATKQKDISDSDSSSKYSYSYQDGSSPVGDAVVPLRIKFKDVEAQEVRDDVTIQIFSDSLDEILSSDSEKQIECFHYNKQKKLLKKKKNLFALKKNVDKSERQSTSIADTESWTTEEIDDQEEEILEIEIEDFDDNKYSSDELLSKTRKKKKARHKRSIFSKIFKTFRRILPVKKKKEKHTGSLYTKNYKDSIQIGDECDNSSSSNSSVCNESHELLVLSKTGDDARVDMSKLRKRNVDVAKYYEDDDLHCTCSKSARKSTKLKKSKPCSHKTYCYPHLMKFRTKEIPSHLKSVCNNIKYFEIDESNYCDSPKEEIKFQTDFSTLTDTRSSVDSDPSRERRSSTHDAEDSYIYTSENNGEKRYDTQSQTSDSSIPEDLDFSNESSVTSNIKILPTSKEKATIDNEKLVSEEEKINEESDEKGSNRIRARSKKIKLHDSLAGLELFNFDRKSNNKKDTMKKKDKSTMNKNEIINEKPDVLKKDKVEKETANVKKKNSLTQDKLIDNDNIIEKIDKSISVNEREIEHDLKNMPVKSNTESSNAEDERYKSSFYLPENRREQQTYVQGFQPIILEKKEHAETRCRCHESEDVVCKSVPVTLVEKNTKVISTGQLSESRLVRSQPATKDQGTYVRIKSKRRLVD